ncbi:MAG: methylmalonyl-CoA mutase family protein [Salinivirgaceae bacterium]|nr:methylmalonyl-CoA mutase family protein [Salinivirgaceae bacterium]
MSEQKKLTRLFDEFPPVSPEAWKEKIITDLKGADFDKKLVWKPREGFAVQPFYTANDIKTLNHLDSNPGEFPYVRGNKTKDNDWFVSQNICACDTVKANKKVLEVLNKGVTSVCFEYHTDKKQIAADIEALLNNICLEAAEINFAGVVGILDFTDALLSVLSKRKIDPVNFNGSINYDPIGRFTLKGNFCTTQEDSLGKCKTIIQKFDKHTGFKAITVSGIHFSNAGATTVQELAYTLAMGSEYVAQLSNLGLSVEKINESLKFHLGVGGNYFFEIAKFRAARLLWSQVMQQYGASKAASKMHIHAQTSDWNKTVYDPYSNVLRSTTEAMAAALGGVESLVVNPFNQIFEETNPISERIARNQQIVLKEESFFDKIIDPAAGSYYIENLTQQIAENAWKLFLEIENKGGYLTAFREQFIQKSLNEEAKARLKDIANRKENLLGTNQFPNFSESKENIDIAILKPCDLTKPEAEVPGIIRYRGAQEIEQLRHRTDVHAKSNKRPLAFMLTYGQAAFSNARSQFAQNFFAVAGFAVKDNSNFNTVEEGIAAAKKAGADIIVLCSSDEEYAEMAPKANELADKDAVMVVAGFPKDIVDELKSKGIKHFIHVRSNILETLETIQKEIGIK